MDEGCKELVAYFNEHGLETYMSCEGHWPERPNMSLFWISFTDKVTDEQIMQFKKEHNDLFGWFVKRLIYEDWLEWRYIAANKTIAHLDYELLTMES